MAAVDRQTRAGLALGGVAWAYLRALSRNDLVRATGILSTFQQLFNENRAALLSTYPADQRAAADSALPRSLPINGVYGQSTFVAVAATLAKLGQPVTGTVSSLPNSDFQIGGWFNSTLRDLTLQPGAQRIVGGAVGAAGGQHVGSPLDAGHSVGAWFFGYTEGLEDMGAPTTAGGAIPAGNERASGILEQAKGFFSAASFGGAFNAMPGGAAPPLPEEAAVADLASAAVDQLAFAPQLVTGAVESAWGNWRYWVIGAGVLGLGGILLYQIAYKGSRRRRR